MSPSCNIDGAKATCFFLKWQEKGQHLYEENLQRKANSPLQRVSPSLTSDKPKRSRKGTKSTICCTEWSHFWEAPIKSGSLPQEEGEWGLGETTVFRLEVELHKGLAEQEESLRRLAWSSLKPQKTAQVTTTNRTLKWTQTCPDFPLSRKFLNILISCDFVVCLLSDASLCSTPYQIFDKPCNPKVFGLFCQASDYNAFPISLDHLWDASTSWLESSCGNFNGADMIRTGTNSPTGSYGG